MVSWAYFKIVRLCAINQVGLYAWLKTLEASGVNTREYAAMQERGSEVYSNSRVSWCKARFRAKTEIELEYTPRTYVRTYVRNSSHWRLRAARNESSRRLAARRARRAGQIAGTQQSLAGLRAGIVAAACVPRYTRSRSVTRSRDYSFWYHSRLYLLLLRDQESIFSSEKVRTHPSFPVSE